MERLRRLTAIWSWLPTFRAVAELEHLQRAARALATSPSAVSRTIHLLEDQLGTPLFSRDGGHLRLNDRGRELLSAVREAMRRVDDAVPGDAVSPISAALRVSSQGRLTTVYVLPALRRIRREHPGVVPHVSNVAASKVAAELLRGDLDVAIALSAAPADGIDVLRLGAAENAIYCGVGHPLHGATELTIDELLQHAFTAPEPRDDGVAVDNWPAEIPRRIGLYSSLLDGAIDACGSGELLAVFPHAVVPTFAAAETFYQLPLDIVPPTSIFGITRASVGKECVADEVIREVRRQLDHFAGVASGSAQRSSASRATEAGTAGETTETLPAIT